MKKVNIKGKKFKVIPEAKLVTGKKVAKQLIDDMKYGVRFNEADLIADTALILGISFFSNDDYITANAYCDERDEWDEKRGIEVCASKLDMKNHYRLAKQYSRICRLLMETSNTVYKLCKMHVDKAKAIEDDLVRHYGRAEV